MLRRFASRSFPRPSHRAQVITTCATAILVAILSSTAAHAQRTDPTPPPAELVRKVEAGERENGFCATVNWPYRTSTDDFQRYLDQGAQNAVFLARSDYGTTGGCSYYLIQSAFQQGERRCVGTLS